MVLGRMSATGPATIGGLDQERVGFCQTGAEEQETRQGYPFNITSARAKQFTLIEAASTPQKCLGILQLQSWGIGIRAKLDQLGIALSRLFSIA